MIQYVLIYMIHVLMPQQHVVQVISKYSINALLLGILYRDYNLASRVLTLDLKLNKLRCS